MTLKEESPPNLDGVADLYTDNLKTHSLTPRSVGWRDEVSQELRFDKLAQVIEKSSGPAGITVNDMGCGYGAMFAHLDNLRRVRLERYFGYDISDAMVSAAQRHVDDPRAEFLNSPRVTHKADYSFVSGTFNVKLDETAERWTEYVKEALMNLASLSTKGLAFNLLTTYVDWKQDNLYYADPFEYFDFCKRNISRYVSLIHDYPLYEWSILVRKGE